MTGQPNPAGLDALCIFQIVTFSAVLFVGVRAQRAGKVGSISLSELAVLIIVRAAIILTGNRNPQLTYLLTLFCNLMLPLTMAQLVLLVMAKANTSIPQNHVPARLLGLPYLFIFMGLGALLQYCIVLRRLEPSEVTNYSATFTVVTYILLAILNFMLWQKRAGMPAVEQSALKLVGWCLPLMFVRFQLGVGIPMEYSIYQWAGNALLELAVAVLASVAVVRLPVRKDGESSGAVGRNAGGKEDVELGRGKGESEKD